VTDQDGFAWRFDDVSFSPIVSRARSTNARNAGEICARLGK